MWIRFFASKARYTCRIIINTHIQIFGEDCYNCLSRKIHKRVEPDFTESLEILNQKRAKPFKIIWYPIAKKLTPFRGMKIFTKPIEMEFISANPERQIKAAKIYKLIIFF